MRITVRGGAVLLQVGSITEVIGSAHYYDEKDPVVILKTHGFLLLSPKDDGISLTCMRALEILQSSQAPDEYGLRNKATSLLLEYIEYAE